MFGKKMASVSTYYAVYVSEYSLGPSVDQIKAPDDMAALTTAQALVGTGYSHHKLIGVLRADGHSVADYSESERHTADLERELGYR